MHRDWPAITARVLAEDPQPVAKIAKDLPSPAGEGHLTPGIVVRWILKGKGGVFLDGYRGPGKSWWTSKAAVARFFAGLSSGTASKRSTLPPPEPAGDLADRQKRAAAAAAEIDRLRKGEAATAPPGPRR
jgi:hypothetical protein